MIMRENKFRAWDNVDNKMLYPGEEDDIHFYFNSNGIIAERFRNIVVDTAEGDRVPDVSNELLEHLQYMEYTGLKDREGNSICEGDIVSIKAAGEDHIRYIQFDQGTFHFGYIPDGMCDYKDMKVIGNIYEDKHLLQQP